MNVIAQTTERSERPARGKRAKRHGPVGRPKTANTRQIVVRVTPEMWERLSALVPVVARPGIAATVSDVVRAALEEGVNALEADQRKPRGKR
jgi:hypothetical protein